MSSPGTPAPPTSLPPAVAAAPAAAVPAVETVDTTSDLSPAAVSPQGSVPTQNSVVTPVAQVDGMVGDSVAPDGTVITIQPTETFVPGTPLPEFTTISATTPAPEKETEKAAEDVPKPTWAHSLFGCFDMDMKLLGLTMCCPCITFGANAELMGEDWMLYCLFCILPGPMCYFGPYIRHKIRKTFEIEETDQQDVLSYLLCPCLAIVQETQQLKSAGMKPGGDAMNRGS